MSPILIVVIALVGSAGITAIVLTIVFSAVRRRTQRAMAELEPEGIVKDSGSVRVSWRFHDFRAPRIYTSVGAQVGPGRLVLTRRRLAVLPGSWRRPGFDALTPEVLAKFQVGTKDGKLHLHTESPPGATGTVDVYASVPDATAWVSALTQLGARPLAS